jgi:hypothetical protein
MLVLAHERSKTVEDGKHTYFRHSHGDDKGVLIEPSAKRRACQSSDDEWQMTRTGEDGNAHTQIRLPWHPYGTFSAPNPDRPTASIICCTVTFSGS